MSDYQKWEMVTKIEKIVFVSIELIPELRDTLFCHLVIIPIFH